MCRQTENRVSTDISSLVEKKAIYLVSSYMVKTDCINPQHITDTRARVFVTINYAKMR